jgi:hypothetical protein
METIDSLVIVDDKATFRNDVQLSLFDDISENMALLQSYIFTVAAPSESSISAAKKVSSVDLLRQLIEAFVNPRFENRFVTIANYGHGKSHLALALTNYFSKPRESAETQIVLDKLAHALNDPAESSFFRDFKQNRGEFLVIRLRGDTPNSLREQFIPALEGALTEHVATQDRTPPIWHPYAEALLSSLTPDEVERANAALAVHGEDVPTLIAKVQDREDVRDSCVTALTAAKGMVPNLGAQASLRETIEWAADTLCGEGKPLGGLVILLDEFSLYINRYAQRSAVGELQDLLNGVSNRAGRVVFLAFAQHDPLTVADNANISSHARDTLKHELTRIPKKFALYSLMESVIDAYLRQREYAWGAFSSQPDVKDQLEWATHIAHSAFEARYARELGWLTDQFYKTVTKGCFPLHPLSTALLCNLRFSEGDGMSDPRTVLGFIMQQRDNKMKEPLLTNDQRVNWVLPVDLVDYFEQRISQEWYTPYVKARRNVAANPDGRALLKALYLQHSAEVNLSRDTQVDFLAEAAGLSPEQTKRTLEGLYRDNTIRLDSVKQTYSLWPANTDPGKLDALLSAKLAHISTGVALTDALNRYTRANGFDAISVNVPWGSSLDWAANQLVFTREAFTVDILTVNSRRFTVKGNNIEEGDRGLVVWLLAQDEDDVVWFRENAEQILDSAVNKNAPVPVVIVLPREPLPDLIKALRSQLALEAFEPSERTLVGQAVYDHERQQVVSALTNEISRLFGPKARYLQERRVLSSIVVPVALRATISGLSQFTLSNVLTQAYQIAYRHAPEEFYTHYRITGTGSTKLRDAVKAIAGILVSGRPESLATAISTQPVAVQLRDTYLVNSWGVLTSTSRIQAPKQRRLQRAWEFLNEAFSPKQGEVLIIKPLITLLNPPFGYDYNTALLIFAAWYAFNHFDLEVRTGGRMGKASILGEILQGGPKDFFLGCVRNRLALQQRDLGAERKLIIALIHQNADGAFTEPQALEAIAKLAAFVSDERNQPQEREAAQTKVNELSSALDATRTYGKRAEEIEFHAKHGSDVPELVEVLTGLSDLPRPTLVKTDASTPQEMRTALVTRLAEVVNAQCRRYEHPEDTSQVELYRSRLNSLRVAVETAERPDLIARVKTALATLEYQATALDRRRQESAYLQRINAVSLTSNLSTLRETHNELAGYKIQTMDIARERDKKVVALEQTIQELDRFANDLPDRCANVNGRHAVDKLRDEIMRHQARFIGSDHEQFLADSLAQMDGLRAFFDELDDFKRHLPQSQADVERVMRRYEALVNQYQHKLSSVQRGLLADVQNHINDYVAKCEERARKWFGLQVEQVRNGVNPTHVAQQLGKLPPFFPDDLREKWQALRAEVQARIDSDSILKVEEAFRMIVGREKQEECLQRLTQILQHSTFERVG